ncbi:hypothetical protein BRADI_4g21601v3 [Brachypodium distachyon]|uniref:Uncharacterized protein n=1 Tax=Brachypodium distachyon TaxID=15368 RepID=A0A2K2CP94_BRADI|nr:hypothetical protein BRADI_4g21601v3 [Brachypodium distachyon]
MLSHRVATACTESTSTSLVSAFHGLGAAATSLTNHGRGMVGGYRDHGRRFLCRVGSPYRCCANGIGPLPAPPAKRRAAGAAALSIHARQRAGGMGGGWGQGDACQRGRGRDGQRRSGREGRRQGAGWAAELGAGWAAAGGWIAGGVGEGPGAG